MSDGTHTPASSDSDDELPSMIDVLWSPTVKKAPHTPLKTRAMASSASEAIAKQLSLSPPVTSPLRPVARQPCAVNYKYSLDNLIKSHSKKKEMKAIDEDLRKQIQHGGLLAMADVDQGAEAELPENLELSKTEVDEITKESGAVVPDFPPPEEIFIRGNKVAGVPQLQFPAGYQPNSFEKLIQQFHSNGCDTASQVVALGMHRLVHAARPCQRDVFVWLLRTGAQHRTQHVASEAIESVCVLTKKWGGKETACLVHVEDVVWMMTAHGVLCTALLGVEGTEVRRQDLREKIKTDFPLLKARKRKGSSRHADQSCEGDLEISFYFRLMLKALAVSFGTNPSFYSVSDVEYLLYLLLRSSLDSSLAPCCVPLTLCLSWVLEALTEDQWQHSLSGLCDAMLDITSHHHQMYFAAQSMPPTPRGRQLQKLYSFRCLFSISLNEPTAGSVAPAVVERLSCPPVIQLSSLLTLIHTWKVSPNYTTDYYAFHSAVLLLDMCVGSDMLSAKHKGDVQVLMQVLNVLKHDIRDLNGLHMDRMKVKDLLMRLHVRYDIWLRSSQTSEAKVDDYFNRAFRNSTDEALKVAGPEEMLTS